MAEIPEPERIPKFSDGEVPSEMPRGHWYPGMPSPNPAGRPKGIIDRRHRHRKALDELTDDAICVLESAVRNDNDLSAVTLVLSRTVPALKPESGIVQFELDVTASVVDQCRQVLKATADGHITFEQAKQFVDLIGTIKDLGDVEAALDELRRLKRGKSKSDNMMPAGHVLQVDTRVIDGKLQFVPPT